MSRMKPAGAMLAASLGWAALLGAAAPVAGAGYSVGGYVSAYASPSGPATERGTSLIDLATLASDDLTVNGSTGAGNFARARFRADLSTGELGAYSETVNAFDPDWPDPGSNSWLGARAVSDAQFTDTLLFTIPAGTYSGGLVATLTGRMTGQIVLPGVAQGTSVVGSSSWGVEFQRTLGGNNTLDSINESSGLLYAASTPQTYTVDRPFSLQINLLDAGTVLTAPGVVDARVTAYIGHPAANAVEVFPNESASATADFYGSLKLQSVGAPPGVTWTSASNVFLIPEPSSFLMLLAGLPLMLWARRRLAR
jgi:hypothetical protein